MIRLLVGMLLCWFSLCGFAQAEESKNKVGFKSHDWTVYRNIDGMTDKLSCVAIHKMNWIIQANQDVMYINMRGRGGVSAYKIRLDSAKPSNLLIAKGGSSVITLKNEFPAILQSKRLRLEILTILDRVLLEDISLSGLQEAVNYMKTNDC